MTEKITRPKTRKILRNLPDEAVNAILSNYHEEMEAGVSDNSLSDETGILPRTIAKYRAKNIARRYRKGGRSYRKEREQYMIGIDLFADENPPEFVTAVESSVLDHRWEPPTFVRRRPMDYDSMCFGMYQLNRYGMSTERLAHAFGLLVEDVDDAIELYKAYLEREGVICPLCRSNKIDPYQQKGCVPRCHVKEIGDDTL